MCVSTSALKHGLCHVVFSCDCAEIARLDVCANKFLLDRWALISEPRMTLSLIIDCNMIQVQLCNVFLGCDF